MSTKTRYEPKGMHFGGSYQIHQTNTSNGSPYAPTPINGTMLETSKGFLEESLTSTKYPDTPVTEVLHTKLDYSVFPAYLGTYTRGAGAVTRNVTGPFTIWSDMVDGGSPVVPPKISLADLNVTYPKTNAQLLEEARQAFYDVNETDNLLNILEAGQTLNSMVQVGNLMVAIKNNVGSLLSGSRSKATDRKLKSTDLSNVYLGWSFGFAPLLSDIRKLAKQLPHLRGNLSRLAANTARPISVVRSCVGNCTFITPPAGSYGTWSGQYTDYQHWWTEQLTAVHRPMKRAGVHGTRSIHYKTKGLQEIDYLLSKYIATGPFSLAWEKVKFSFAVDWFANLTGTIDRLDNVLTGQRKKIQYAWTSEKFHYIGGVIYGTYGDRNYPGFAGKLVAQSDIKKYHRIPGSVDFSPQWSGRFGKKQMALSVALLHQMVANLKR
jgi:hypothetical protein